MSATSWASIADVKKTYAVDAKRIFALGHSNGGFMVNRLACDQADKIAAVVSLAGETYHDQTKCAASAPIAYLQVQGDADMTVPYAGGHPENIAILPLAPGAVETAQDWAKKNGCDPTRRHLPAADHPDDHIDGPRHHQARLQQVPGQRLDRALDHPPRPPLTAVHGSVGSGRPRLHDSPPETLRRTA